MSKRSYEVDLFRIVNNQYFEKLESVVRDGADVNVLNYYGETILGCALSQTYSGTRIAEFLINNGANVNLASKGQFPLVTAITNGHIEIAKLLIEKGADLNAISNGAYTALHLAITDGHIEIAKLLIEKGADLNLRSSNQTPLYTSSARVEMNEIAKLLIEKGADLNTSCGNNTTALDIACVFNNSEIVKLLIEKGANCDLDSSLSYAIDYKNIEIAKLLIEKGANVNLHKALSYAINNKNILLIKLLIEKGLTLKAIEDGQPPLSYAANIELTETLIRSDAQIVRQNVKPAIISVINNIDHIGVSQSEYNLIKLLIENGANINEPDKDGHTPLSHAVRGYANKYQVYTSPNIGLMKTLISKFDANLNAICKDGHTPLSYAIQLNYMEAVKVLIYYYANINQRNTKGDRPIDFVAEKDIALIKLLRENGSVEPKKLIDLDDASVQKLIFAEGKAPDSVPGNIGKTIPILNKMTAKFPLTDAEVDSAIAWFKTTQDFTTYKAEWGAVSDEMTVLDVINKLSTMTDVHDRLSSNWDFKKVLGTIIHIVKDNEDLTNNLIDTLAQIRLCALSKLMNLLYVVQDLIIESDKVDYSKIQFSAFNEVIKVAVDDVQTEFGEKSPLIVIKWLIDHLNKQGITDPEQWSTETQVVQGRLAKSFMNQTNIKVDNASYHFTNGLEGILIQNMLEKLNIQGSKSEDAILKVWQELVETGVQMLATGYFDKIVAGSVKVSDLENACYAFDLVFGRLKALDVGVIKHYHDLISKKFSTDIGQLFIKQLDDCELNDEATNYIKTVLNQHNSEGLQHLMSVDPIDSAGNVDISLQGNVDQTDNHDII